jgi:hypothetical protein
MADNNPDELEYLNQETIDLRKRIAEQRKAYKELEPKIRQHFREGRSREEIFSLSCQYLNLPSLTMDQIVEYFQKIKDYDNVDQFDEDHFDLVIKIKTELGKLQSAMATWPFVDEEKRTFQFLNSRYALSFVHNGSELKLSIYDCYHEDEIR